MLTYKELQALTGESHTNLRQLAFTKVIPEPDGRIGISPYWNDTNPGIITFLANHKAAKRHASEEAQ